MDSIFLFPKQMNTNAYVCTYTNVYVFIYVLSDGPSITFPSSLPSPSLDLSSFPWSLMVGVKNVEQKNK